MFLATTYTRESNTDIPHFFADDGTMYASISRQTTPAPLVPPHLIIPEDDLEPYAELRVDATVTRQRTHTGSSSLGSSMLSATEATIVEPDFHSFENGSPTVQPYAASMFNIVDEERPMRPRRATVSGKIPQPYSLPSPSSPLSPPKRRSSLQNQTGSFGSAPQFTVQRKKSHAGSSALLPTVGEERMDGTDSISPMNKDSKPIFTIPSEFSVNPDHSDTERSPLPYLESPANMRKFSMPAGPFHKDNKRPSMSLPRNLSGISASEAALPYLDFSPTTKKKFLKQNLGHKSSLNASESKIPSVASQYEVPAPVIGTI